MKTVGLYNNDFLTMKTDEVSLKESVERILMTSVGERVNNPLFGSNLKDFIFQFDTYLLEDIQIEIIKSINKWEPRVDVTDIKIEKMEEFRYSVVVDCTTKGTKELFSLDLTFNL